MSLTFKEEVELINKKKGQIIGMSLKKDREFVLEKKGREGLKRVEEEMEKFGFSLKYEQIINYKWYPVQLDPLFLLVAKKTFHWNDKMMREWGCWAAKTHFLAKIMAKFFVSKKKFEKAGVATRFWRKYYTQGLLIVHFDDRNRCGTVEIRDFLVVPIHCRYLEGYFSQIVSLVILSSKLKIEETPAGKKNTFRFKITW